MPNIDMKRLEQLLDALYELAGDAESIEFELKTYDDTSRRALVAATSAASMDVWSEFANKASDLTKVAENILNNPKEHAIQDEQFVEDLASKYDDLRFRVDEALRELETIATPLQRCVDELKSCLDGIDF